MEAAANYRNKVPFVGALLLLLVSTYCAVVSDAQICKVSVQDLLSCKPAATPPNPPKPTPQCCSVLSRADLPCLCSYKNNPVLPSVGIDPALAFQLPAAVFCLCCVAFHLYYILACDVACYIESNNDTYDSTS